LKDNGETPIALGSSLGWEPLFWFDYMILRIAGPEFREGLMWGTESYNDPLVVEAMEKWGELLEAGFFNEDITSIGFDEMTPMVADGSATMMLMGPWAIDGLSQAGLVPGEDFDMFPFPTIDPSIPDATEGAMEGWAVTGANDNAPAVQALLECMAGSEQLTNYASSFPSLTPNPEVSIDVYPAENQPILERLQVLTEASFHQNLELATIPPVTDVAKREIPRFLTFPDQYPQVLQALQDVSDREFAG
jgi:multiple sugar transport system substrate-binding protein/raffinose/stachyose/melibiose transport system substrate-binding protein